MLTPVERVLIFRNADLLKDVGPRHLLELAEVAREIEFSKGDTIFREEDPADALYMVVEGRVRLSAGDRTISEVGPGESFGTWALVDDSGRGQRAECLEDGLTLALHRDEFYDVASGDLTLLQQVVHALARRLRALVSERPEEARVEGEGIEKPEALAEAEDAARAASPEAATPSTPGATLAAAAVGQPPPPSPEIALEIEVLAAQPDPEAPPSPIVPSESKKHPDDT